MQPTEKPVSGAILGSIPRSPAWIYYSLLICIVGWIVLRTLYLREDGQKKAVLAKSCRQTMKQAEASLYWLLVKADPMSELNKLIDEVIIPTVDRNI